MGDGLDTIPSPQSDPIPIFAGVRSGNCSLRPNVPRPSEAQLGERGRQARQRSTSLFENIIAGKLGTKFQFVLKRSVVQQVTFVAIDEYQI